MPTFIVTKEVVIEIDVDPKALTPEALEEYEKHFHNLGADKKKAMLEFIAQQCALEYSSRIEGVGFINEASRGGVAAAVTYKILEEKVEAEQVES